MLRLWVFFLVVLLKFTPLEFETRVFDLIVNVIVGTLKFTPLEFETYFGKV